MPFAVDCVSTTSVSESLNLDMTVGLSLVSVNHQADKFIGAITVWVLRDFCYNFSAIFSKCLSAH